MEYLGPVLLIIIVAVGVALGYTVFRSKTSNRAINLSFLGSTIAVILWNIFGYLGYWVNNSSLAVTFFRINYAAVALTFITYYFFSTVFPVRVKKNIVANWTILSLGCFFLLSSLFTNFVIKDVEYQSNAIIMKTGILGNAFLLYTLLTTFYILYLFIRQYRQIDQINKLKVRYLILGTFFWAIFNIIFNIVVSLSVTNYRLTQFGDFSAIFFLGFTAYAVLKYQLFNIKVIATETAIIAVSLALLVQIFISNSFAEGSINAIIWILATYGGLELIKSVKHEIRQREELAKLAKKLEQANEHLKEVDKLKDDFLSMASHELNTPIAAIEGYLSMILVEKMAGEIPPKAKQYLDSVFKSSQRLAGMVKDLLNVSRIESNRIHLLFEQKPIEDIVKQSIMEVMSKAREAHHTLVFDEPKKAMPHTWYDVTRITEILINIMGNAIKYTDPGGKITVRCSNDEGKIVVAVEDNGRGIPKEKQAGVFEKFTQVDVLKDQVKGTGLGMYISKKFIELHKGKIWFHSDGEGKGTTFYFSIPVLAKKPFDPHEGEGLVLH